MARRSDHARPRSVNVRAETTRRNPNTRLDVRPEACPAPPPIAATTVPHSNIVIKINIHPSIEVNLLTAPAKFAGSSRKLLLQMYGHRTGFVQLSVLAPPRPSVGPLCD